MNAKRPMRTDPDLWVLRPEFGVAGGPLTIALSDFGELRAFSVGAQVRMGGPAEAMMELVATGGCLPLSERCGSTIRAAPSAARHSHIHWMHLHTLGYVEFCYADDGQRVTLTASGQVAAKRAETERGALLDRCRRAAETTEDAP